jgi:hypothetical protein
MKIVTTRLDADPLARSFLPAVVVFMVLYYSALLAVSLAWPYFHLFQPVYRGLTFNSMLDHLLQGQFDVDPATILDEGFVENGKTITYYGVSPALLRLLLIPIGALHSLDMTRFSCAAGAATAGCFKLGSLLQVYRRCKPSLSAKWLFWATALSVVFGGAQVSFLRPSVYQETIIWAGAMAAIFVYCAVRGIVTDRAFSGTALAQMALAAGFALLTRVTFGIALYAALGFLILSLALREAAGCSGFFGSLFAGRFARPLAILFLFAGLCGGINYGRWGNPLTFIDLQHYYHSTPQQLALLEKYGEFNPVRLLYGSMYYFLPLWTIVQPNGSFLFSEFQERYLFSIELPPSSFFLSDPLLVLLDGVFIVMALRRQIQRDLIDLRASVALLAGLAIAPLLIMIAITMAFRYRMEFYPVIELAAFLGIYAACSSDIAFHDGALRRATWACAIAGIVVSQLLMVAYKVSPFGSPHFPDHVGWVGFYSRQLEHARLLGN